MDKVILVIDKPNKCSDCPVHGYVFETSVCKQEARKCNPGRKPKWCPLKDMPKKMGMNYRDWNHDIKSKGWDACIDEILKGSEET